MNEIKDRPYNFNSMIGGKMKIHRLYYLEQECIPSNYIDEYGYVDDYYDNYVDHDITLGYFANTKAINKWIDEHITHTNGDVFIDNKFVCYDKDLQSEEIEVIE